MENNQELLKQGNKNKTDIEVKGGVKDDLKVPIPHKHQKAKYVFGAIFIIVLVVIGYLLFNFNKNIKTPVKDSLENSNSQATSTISNSRLNSSLKRSNITFPDIQKKEAGDRALLKDFNNFILENYTNIQIQKLTYADNTQGLEVSYNISSPAVSTTLAVKAASSAWKLTMSSRTDFSGFLEYDSQKYKIRVTITEDDNHNSTVTLQSITK